ncbi:MAG: hypothetical protein ACRD3W_13685, partial [Terriglobales bacterium]
GKAQAAASQALPDPSDPNATWPPQPSLPPPPPTPVPVKSPDNPWTQAQPPSQPQPPAPVDEGFWGQQQQAQADAAPPQPQPQVPASGSMEESIEELNDGDPAKQQDKPKKRLMDFMPKST